jgi:uncharacterized protein (DUF433 family)
MTVDSRFTVPLYTASGAASHLGMAAATLGRWIHKDQLITSVPGAGREPRLPFMGLVEAQFYKELRGAGLSLQAITKGMKVVRDQLGARMLQRGVIAHDGREILMNLALQGDPDWVRARDRQGGLPQVIEIGLKPIIWADDGLPGRVILTAYGPVDVIADPDFAFGQPIVESSGARVEDILGLFKAGEPVTTVAEEMDVSAADVESIVRTWLPVAA